MMLNAEAELLLKTVTCNQRKHRKLTVVCVSVSLVNTLRNAALCFHIHPLCYRVLGWGGGGCVIPASRFRALKINPERYYINNMRRGVEAYVNKFIEDILDEVKTYPPPPQDSKYVRRGEEGGILGSWQHTSSYSNTNGLRHSLFNTATDPRGRRYFTYVQGAWQTALHATTGWRNLDEAVAAKRREYRNGLQAIYTKNIRRQI